MNITNVKHAKNNLCWNAKGIVNCIQPVAETQFKSILGIIKIVKPIHRT